MIRNVIPYAKAASEPVIEIQIMIEHEATEEDAYCFRSFLVLSNG
jgi:hypothetical protein